MYWIKSLFIFLLYDKKITTVYLPWINQYGPGPEPFFV